MSVALLVSVILRNILAIFHSLGTMKALMSSFLSPESPDKPWQMGQGGPVFLQLGQPGAVRYIHYRQKHSESTGKPWLKPCGPLANPDIWAYVRMFLLPWLHGEAQLSNCDARAACSWSRSTTEEKLCAHMQNNEEGLETPLKICQDQHKQILMPCGCKTLKL